MIEDFLKSNQTEIIRFVSILFIGYLLIKILMKILRHSKAVSKIDPTVGSFLLGLLKFLLYAVYFIILLTVLGVPMTTFVAMVSAIGLAIALALQGNLSNFASAIVILVFKPFKVGDYIECDAFAGTVNEIQILFTHILTVDNRRVIIPNTDLVSGKVINYTAEDKRRIDLLFSTSYRDDVDKVKEIMGAIVEEHDLILKDPEPVIRLGGHGPSSLDYDMKIWVRKEDFWTVKYDMNEKVKKAFDREGITIPFPQREVWMGEVE